MAQKTADIHDHFIAIFIGGDNGEHLEAITRPLRQDPTCDHFPNIPARQVRDFLHSNKANILPLMAELPVPADGPVAQRGVFHGDPEGRARRWQGNEAAWLDDAMVVDRLKDGRFYARMSALQDHKGQQYAVFYRADTRSDWAVAHGYAEAESAYQHQVRQHEPIADLPLLHAHLWRDSWGSGHERVTLDRSFIDPAARKAYVMTLHVWDAQTRTLSSAWIPEDSFIPHAQPRDIWEQNAVGVYGRKLGGLDIGQTIDALAPCLDAAGGRFSVIKYGEPAQGVKILDGAYTAPRMAPLMIAPYLKLVMPAHIRDALYASGKPPMPHVALLSEEQESLFRQQFKDNVTEITMADYLARHGHHLYPLPGNGPDGQTRWSIHRVVTPGGGQVRFPELPYVMTSAQTQVRDGRMNVTGYRNAMYGEAALLSVMPPQKAGQKPSYILLQHPTHSRGKAFGAGPAVGTPNWAPA